MSLAYIKNKSDPKIEPWCTPQDGDPKLTRKDMLETYDLNQLTVCFEKPIEYNFCNNSQLY